MPKRTAISKQAKAHTLFARGSKDWDVGKLSSALRLFVAAAEAGDRAALLNVGYFYDNGIGIKQSRSSALRWYKRAYLRGDASAANNIGTIWRDKGELKRARLWFLRAIKLGNIDSNIEVAKCYVDARQPNKAILYLQKVVASKVVTEDSVIEAKRLLRKIASASERN